MSPLPRFNLSNIMIFVARCKFHSLSFSETTVPPFVEGTYVQIL